MQLGEIIDGMEMDLTQTRYLDFAGLERYCYHVAGAVGLLAAGIFGYRNPRTLEYARNLGTAFQLTNIIRDVGEDARKNRIYLPMDELKRFEVPASDILQAKYSENFRQLMEFQTRRAESFYDKAMQSLPAEDRRTQRAGLIMAAIYRATLVEIEQRRLQGPHAAHLAHPAAQAVAGLENMDQRVAIVGARATRAWLPRSRSPSAACRSRCSNPARFPAAARAA